MSRVAALMEVDKELGLVQLKIDANYAAGHVGRAYELVKEKLSLTRQRQRLIDAGHGHLTDSGPLRVLDRQVEEVCVVAR